MGDFKHLTDEQIALCAEAVNHHSWEELPAEWRQHVAGCDDCAFQITQVSELTETETKIQLPQKKIISLVGWSGIAASMLILITGGYYLLRAPLKSLPQSQAQNSETIKTQFRDSSTSIKLVDPGLNLSQSNSTKTTNKPDIIIQVPSNQKDKPDMLAYAPQPQMEQLVERFQGSAMRGGNITVQSPATIKSGSPETIKLEWENTETQTLLVEFYNNKGEKLFEDQTTQNSYIPSQIKNKGLYYWKLISADYDLIFCGKIIIE